MIRVKKKCCICKKTEFFLHMQLVLFNLTFGIRNNDRYGNQYESTFTQLKIKTYETIMKTIRVGYICDITVFL